MTPATRELAFFIVAWLAVTGWGSFALLRWAARFCMSDFGLSEVEREYRVMARNMVRRAVFVGTVVVGIAYCVFQALKDRF